MKEKLITYFRLKHNSVNLSDIIHDFNLTKMEEVEELKKYLDILEIEGKLYKDENNEYINFPRNTDLIQGRLSKDSKNKFYIINVLDNKKIYLSRNYLNGALKGDIIVGVLDKKDINYKILWDAPKILKRDYRPLLYECRITKGIKKIVPINNEYNDNIIFNDIDNYTDGQRLLVELPIVRENNKYIAKVIDIVGHKNDPDIKTKQIIKSYHAEIDFPEEVKEEVAKIPTTISKEEIGGRLDLRDEIIFTIDGKDTKDMDDAISLRINEKGNYVLGVHIAHVSHYIKLGSKIFEDALRRGCSIYTVDTVVPMISHILSNGICSLNENVDRLTKSCIMEIDKTGNIIDSKIVNSVINSKKKMTYEEVNKILEKGKIPVEYEKYVDNLKKMQELSQIFTNKRHDNGGIEFCENELKIRQENDKIVSISKSEHGLAQKLIENFMIAANETVAKNYFKYPFLYRTHEQPEEDRMVKAFEGIRAIGIKVKWPNNKTNSKELQTFLASVKNRPEYPLISNCLLRAMPKAIYSSLNTGHFALGSTWYTHFTSPIRRISDLTVENLIDMYESGFDMSDFEKIKNIESILDDIAFTASCTEQREETIERERDAIAIIDYMNDNIDKIYNAKINCINSERVFITLENGITAILGYESLKEYRYNSTKNNYYSKEKETLRAGDIIRVCLNEKAQSTLKIKIVDEKKKKLEEVKVKQLKK